MNALTLAERQWIPDALIRSGIRRLLHRRLRAIQEQSPQEADKTLQAFVERMRRSPVAVSTAAANEQHYEVPPEFFQRVLGQRLKYSCCWYNRADTSLADAEEAMLQLTSARAELADGQRILELGCGWGSLTLWMAEQFPDARITAVSNSRSQRDFILRRCETSGFANVEVITADVREFSTEQRFDRVVSVEMFEHMRNYELLLRRIRGWLESDGKLFVHIFCHRRTPYVFESEGAANWMGRHFFTGGMMPSYDLLAHFNSNLAIEQKWRINGLHYARTCEDWLQRLDTHRPQLLGLFQQQRGRREGRLALQRWRMFFMACAELFRYNEGDEWFVAHYLLQPVKKRLAGGGDVPQSATADL